MDRLRSLVVLALALGQIIAPALLFSHGSSVDVPGSPAAPTPIVPAGYAFSIWWLIFAGALAQAVLGVLPRYQGHPVLRRIGWLLAVTYAGSIGWMLVARFGPGWLTLPIIVVMLFSVGLAYAWASPAPLLAEAPLLVRTVVVAPLALYAGWLSIAVLANVSELLAAYEVAWFIGELRTFTVALLGVATMIAIEGVIIGGGGLGSIVYAGTVVWALCGIVVANVGSPVAYMAGVSMAIVLLSLGLRRRSAPGPA